MVQPLTFGMERDSPGTAVVHAWVQSTHKVPSDPHSLISLLWCLIILTLLPAITQHLVVHFTHECLVPVTSNIHPKLAQRSFSQNASFSDKHYINQMIITKISRNSQNLFSFTLHSIACSSDINLPIFLKCNIY